MTARRRRVRRPSPADLALAALIAKLPRHKRELLRAIVVVWLEDRRVLERTVRQ